MTLGIQDIDWRELQVRIERTVARKYPGTSPENRQDAVAEAMADLVQRWFDFPSSIEVLAEGDVGKVMSYMVRRGVHTALNYLGRMSEKSDALLNIVDDVEEWTSYTIAVEHVVPVERDERTDEEREDQMLTRLLDKYGVEGLEARTATPRH